MPRAYRRRSGTQAEEISAGRQHLAAIDPDVMRRVVGRPEQRAAHPAEPSARPAVVPAHRRHY